MRCDVIDECRCYAFRGNTTQFCGVRKGSNVVPCPSACCFGGCVNDGSRPPFRYVERPSIVHRFNPVNTLLMIAIAFVLGLKITHLIKT